MSPTLLLDELRLAEVELSASAALLARLGEGEQAMRDTIQAGCLRVLSRELKREAALAEAGGEGR